ncbi:MULTISPECIES: hypothetical protein [unclassified Sphingomonas]|uniref:hypothetical protein n=1 Tax=unclassified Sphingomonas TaxID=196159 RepID=UPI0006FFFA26|nr:MULTISPECIES: hypothetical protein [unclassified Sphingomonas]KQM27720.1 hypothetical protein ASE58_04990 [Sphingomonas sp. Leaf9]KQM44059.1 hypothetical protein ASE57_04985 [Sphingomonas sp. Leaf11]
MRRLVQWLACGAMAFWPVVAQAEWREARSDHFIVYSDDQAKDVVRFAERLERFDATLRLLTKMPATPIALPNRVTVYMTGDMSSIARLARSSNVAGFYIPRAGGSVAFVPKNGSGNGIDPEEVLFHEYTHHFMLSNWAESAFPSWYVEGFAEFFAPTRFRDDGSIEIARPPMYRARQFANGMPISATELLTGDPRKIDSSALYAGGWLLTHMLLLDPARRGQLGQFMEAISAGQPPAKAAAAMGDPRQLDRDMARYARTGLRYSVMPAGAVPQPKVTLRTLTPAEAAMMPVRIRSRRGVDRKAALELLPMAQRLAAPYPADATVQTALAEAEYDAGNYAAAEAAARRGIAADAQAIDAHVYLGMAQVAQARAAHNTDPARWKEIRRSFLAANRIENDDPEPLRLFYQAYQVPGQVPNENARAALLRAHALGPQDRGLRMEAARALLDMDRAAEAKRVLGPVAYAPHGGATAAFAAELIAIIDRDGAKAAIARWQKGSKAEQDDEES